MHKRNSEVGKTPVRIRICQLEEAHKDNGKMEKKIDLIMMSSEIMVTMVGLFTVPSGTMVTMVGLITVPTGTTVKMVGLVTVTIRNNGNKGMQSHGTFIPNGNNGRLHNTTSRKMVTI